MSGKLIPKTLQINFWLIIFVACFLFLSAAACAAEFSANLVFISKETRENGKIAVTDEKVMVKIGELITIARIDKNVMWVIMPKGKMYIKMPLQLQNIFVGTEKIPGELERRNIGKETVDGQEVDKFLVSYLSDNKVYNAFLWMLHGVDIPVKKAAEDGSWVIKYTSILVGKQPDDLFEIPAGYQQLDTNMQSLSGTGGIFGGQ